MEERARRLPDRGYAAGHELRLVVDKHNRHHANPNHVDLDPDINSPAIVYSAEQALQRRGLRRFIAKHQALLLFPLICLLGWSMHAAGIKFSLDDHPGCGGSTS